MKSISLQTNGYRGFSLAELLAALVIGTLILAAVLGVYSRAQQSSSAIIRKLDSASLSTEVLQRIAEDLDRIISPTIYGNVPYTKVTVENKLDNLFSTARLIIERTIYDRTDKPKILEKIVWQTGFDYEGDANGLVLYRSHSGIALEDKLLDEQKERFEREMFVPVCDGVTFFKIQIPQGSISSSASAAERQAEAAAEAGRLIYEEDNFLDEWNKNTLPPGIVVTISFAEPFKTVAGTMEVFDEQKVKRTIAIDRTKKIRFVLPKLDLADEEEPNEPNEPQSPSEEQIEPGEPNAVE